MSHRNDIKHVYVFVPPGTDEHPVVRYLSEKFPPLPTDDILEFYDERIAPYSSSNPKTSFCNGLEDLFEDIADMSNYITLVSMNDYDVFAILIFSINYLDSNGKLDKNIDIYIELFCGNQALPPSGEGTKLLETLEKASLDTKNFKIALSSVPRSVQYYTNKSYHFKRGSSHIIGWSVPMQKNTRAKSHWSKIKDSLGPSSRRYLDKLYSLSKGSKAKGSKNKSSKNKSRKNKSRKAKGKNSKSRKNKK
jgi:hypothetical protein